MDTQQYARTFRHDGYFIRENVISIDDVLSLRQVVANLPKCEEVRRKQNVYGVRNLLDLCPAVRALAADVRVRQFATAILGAEAFAVRAIFFDKVPGANWSLAWHQDKAIAVKERREVPGFVGWSRKASVWQVQPPVEILAEMIAIRVYLDDCGPDNGPLRVLPGSHRSGWLDEHLDDWKRQTSEVVCTVGLGGVVTMCPLTLHASASSSAVGHRRVIHLEYAAKDLPEGLQWNNRICDLPSSTSLTNPRE